jgi:integrase
MRNVLTNILVPLFGRRPIADLTADDILPPFQLIARMGSDRALLKLGVRKTLSRHGRKAQPSPEQARALFTFAKMIFNWALDQRGYGLEHSPLDRVSKVRRLGASVRRDRTLSDEELAALVLAIERLPVPYRQAYQALLHSGLRLNEAAGARWSEIPPDSDVWVIAAERMKGKNSGTGQARPHAVPLTEPLRRIFASMPRGEHGDCIFSHEDGARPIVIGSTRLKRKLDAEMLAMLRQRAAARGENADRVTLSPWRNHDIRRTCRSTLSRLRVADDVAEAILAHQRPGVTGTYDRWHRLPEKRAALERWSRFLAELVRPHSVEARTGTASSVG